MFTKEIAKQNQAIKSMVLSRVATMTITEAEGWGQNPETKISGFTPAAEKFKEFVYDSVLDELELREVLSKDRKRRVKGQIRRAMINKWMVVKKVIG